MIQNIERDSLVDMLLNSLAVERYVRRPLLLELIGELSASARFEPARRSACVLLERLEHGDLSDAELSLAVEEVRAKVWHPTTTEPASRPVRVRPRLRRSVRREGLTG